MLNKKKKVLCQYVGFDKVKLTDNSTIKKQYSEIKFDFNAIAKGYAVDQLAQLLDDAQISNYFLEIGGELKMKGLKPDGSNWVPAIEAPVDTESRVYQVFFSRGANIAVAGSGDYRNYLLKLKKLKPRKCQLKSHKRTQEVILKKYDANRKGRR